MDNQVYRETLPNGIRIIVENIPTMRSVSVGLVVGAGTADDGRDFSGISHYIEHMSFKGTGKRSAFEIAKTLDSVGGKLNAFTGKEYTCYLAVVLDEHIKVALDVLSDIFLNSVFDEKEMELEKQVVLEEISMYQDTPDELIHDLFASTALSNHQIGRPTLGTAESVKRIKRMDIKEYQQKLYTPSNLIVSVAGNVLPEKVKELVWEYFSSFSGETEKERLGMPQIVANRKILKKETEQAHICLGVPGVSHLSDERFPLAILDNVLGGSMSSRLFQEIREKRGLAYAIYTYSSSFRDFGLFAIYAGTGTKNTKKVIEILLKELSVIKKEGISNIELERAKQYLKGNLVLGLESTSSRMSWLSKCEFYYKRLVTIDEIFEKIDKVTNNDIVRLAASRFRDDALNLAVIGNFDDDTFPVKELRL